MTRSSMQACSSSNFAIASRTHYGWLALPVEVNEGDSLPLWRSLSCKSRLWSLLMSLADLPTRSKMLPKVVEWPCSLLAGQRGVGCSSRSSLWTYCSLLTELARGAFLGLVSPHCSLPPWSARGWRGRSPHASLVRCISPLRLGGERDLSCGCGRRPVSSIWDSSACSWGPLFPPE